MIAHWLSEETNRQLIIFCNGWGMDHHPLTALDLKGFDVLVLSDYRLFSLPPGIAELAGRYESIYLLCWSFGVWAAQSLFSECRNFFSRCIAINGTLQPIDDKFGIPHQFFNATREQFSDSVLDRFYRRMCRPQSVLDRFLEKRPARSVEDQREELDMLERLVQSGDSTSSIFDAAVISSRDLIIPTVNQKSFWQDRCRIFEVEGCHFPFGNWTGWSDIIALVVDDAG